MKEDDLKPYKRYGFGLVPLMAMIIAATLIVCAVYYYW